MEPTDEEIEDQIAQDKWEAEEEEFELVRLGTLVAMNLDMDYLIREMGELIGTGTDRVIGLGFLMIQKELRIQSLLLKRGLDDG